MISAVRTTRPPPRGFTLIEIVMVLGISAIVMGGAVGLMMYSSDERELRNASGEIELLAKRARTISILNQTPYALEFRQGIVKLLPLAQAGMDLDKTSSRRPEIEPQEDVANESREVELPAGVEISIRRWNSEEWFGTGKKTVHVWRFDPDGLCEPISLRYSLGKSWAEDTFHPLTATISESSLEAR
ncbi:prepilin-type N-terminal cleavage/methylation domain-containing protein [bacterium]|nr:prepilin-type N-terminal cleavage/methylation domain-containing protein [bacterium]